MVQTCLFDESWAGAGRRRPRSDEAPGECATGVTAELEQLKKSQSGELEQLEARLQSAHSEELEQLKVSQVSLEQLAVRLHASQRELKEMKASQRGELEHMEEELKASHEKEVNGLKGELAQSAEWATQQQLELKTMLAELLSKL